MNLTMRSHHTTLDDGLREHAEKKLARLERYLPRLGDVVVEVERQETRSAGPRASAPNDDETEEYIAGKIVRVKRFEAKPMSAEEALAQMDLLGHDFFLYIDAASSDYALLYKRRDGGFGMLSLSRG